MVENIFTKAKPEFPWVWFGDGCSAEVRSAVFISTNDGLLRYKFVLRPSPVTINRYGLKPGTDMTDDGFMNVSYPKSEVWKLCDDPVYTRWFIVCGFDGKPTDFSSRELYYINQINCLQKINHITQSENSLLYERLKNMAAKQGVYFEDITELLKKIYRSRLLPKNDRDKEEEENNEGN